MCLEIKTKKNNKKKNSEKQRDGAERHFAIGFGCGNGSGSWAWVGFGSDDEQMGRKRHPLQCPYAGYGRAGVATTDR